MKIVIIIIMKYFWKNIQIMYKILYYDRINVSESIDVHKTSVFCQFPNI